MEPGAAVEDTPHDAERGDPVSLTVRGKSAALHEIERLYREHNPAKLVEVPSLVVKYGEPRLLYMVRKKYRPATAATADSSGAWIPARDADTGKVYYHHSVTREVSWNRPSTLFGGSAPEAGRASSAAAAAVSSGSSPAGRELEPERERDWWTDAPEYAPSVSENTSCSHTEECARGGGDSSAGQLGTYSTGSESDDSGEESTAPGINT